MQLDSSKKSGQRLVGDCDYKQCKEVASWITPVPGGTPSLTSSFLILYMYFLPNGKFPITVNC